MMGLRGQLSSLRINITNIYKAPNSAPKFCPWAFLIFVSVLFTLVEKSIVKMSNMMNKFAEKLQGNDDSLQKGKNAKSSNKERDDMNMDMGMGHDQSEGGMKMGHDQSGTKMNAGRGIANDWKTYENMKK